jgi:hypothetical protein
LGGHVMLVVGTVLWTWGMGNNGQLGVMALPPPAAAWRRNAVLQRYYSSWQRARSRNHDGSVLGQHSGRRRSSSNKDGTYHDTASRRSPDVTFDGDADDELWGQTDSGDARRIDRWRADAGSRGIGYDSESEGDDGSAHGGGGGLLSEGSELLDGVMMSGLGSAQSSVTGTVPVFGGELSNSSLPPPRSSQSNLDFDVGADATHSLAFSDHPATIGSTGLGTRSIKGGQHLAESSSTGNTGILMGQLDYDASASLPALHIPLRSYSVPAHGFDPSTASDRTSHDGGASTAAGLDATFRSTTAATRSIPLALNSRYRYISTPTVVPTVSFSAVVGCVTAPILWFFTRLPFAAFGRFRPLMRTVVRYTLADG